MQKIAKCVRALLWAGLLMAAGVLPLSAQGGSPLEARLREVVGRYRENPVNWGICVRSLERGEDLARLNADRPYMPASNLKLLVTAAALDGLGPDFRFSTTVMGDGRLDADSVFQGDLVLRGGGDPTVSDRFYASLSTVWDSLAQAVAVRGIRRVSGSLVIDNTLFHAPFLANGWSWEDLLWWYGAPVSALAFNDNCIDVQVYPAAQVGQPPEVRVRPEGTGVRLVNRANTVASASQSRLDITRDTPGGDIIIRGGIHRGSLGFLEHVAVPDPGRFAGEAFANALARAGVRVDGPLRVLQAPEDRPDYLSRSPLLLAQHQSVPLAEVVKVINKRSHNFYAEQLLFALGAFQGQEGSFQGGVEVEKRFLRRIGVDTRKLVLEDGSGLSRLNLITPEAFCALLAHMRQHQAREQYYTSLKVGGKEPGMYQMRGTSAEDKVVAKTGYISQVMSLSGYATTADGEQVAFSILGNNWLFARSTARQLIRDVCVAITGYRRPLAASN